MTRHEAAVVSAYTGVLCGDFDNVHTYIEEVVGRSVWTHEIPNILDVYHERFGEDFKSIKIEDGGTVNEN